MRTNRKKPRTLCIIVLIDEGISPAVAEVADLRLNVRPFDGDQEIGGGSTLIAQSLVSRMATVQGNQLHVTDQPPSWPVRATTVAVEDGPRGRRV